MLKKQQKKRLQCEIRITVFCLIKLSWVLYIKLFTPHRFPLSKVVSVGKKRKEAERAQWSNGRCYIQQLTHYAVSQVIYCERENYMNQPEEF